jgi:hypothetical protein
MENEAIKALLVSTIGGTLWLITVMFLSNRFKNHNNDTDK